MKSRCFFGKDSPGETGKKHRKEEKDAIPMLFEEIRPWKNKKKASERGNIEFTKMRGAKNDS